MIEINLNYLEKWICNSRHNTLKAEFSKTLKAKPNNSTKLMFCG